MTQPLVTSVTLLSTGFVLGLKHAFDADHVAVVTTMVSQSKSLKKSSLLGAWWGLGHTATLLLAGLIVLMFKIVIPARLALGLEFIVGAVVILFGLDLLWKIRRGRIHAHAHTHGGSMHTHLHSHLDQPSHRHGHRALAVGALHGLAGSAALTLLVLSSVQSIPQGILFILIFGFGSIVSMILISSVIGLPFLLTKGFTRATAIIQAVTGTMSVAVGVLILVTLTLHPGSLH